MSSEPAPGTAGLTDEDQCYDADFHRGGAQLPWENLTDDDVRDFVRAESLLSAALDTNAAKAEVTRSNREGRVVYRMILMVFDDRVVVVERDESRGVTAVASVRHFMVSD